METLEKARKTIDTETIAEIARMDAAGCRRMTIAEIDKAIEPLGFAIDRSSYATSWARIITGPHAGCRFRATTAGVDDKTTGQSAYHYLGRRDAAYRELQRLRREVYAIYRGTVFTL